MRPYGLPCDERAAHSKKRGEGDDNCHIGTHPSDGLSEHFSATIQNYGPKEGCGYHNNGQGNGEGREDASYDSQSKRDEQE